MLIITRIKAQIHIVAPQTLLRFLPCSYIREQFFVEVAVLEWGHDAVLIQLLTLSVKSLLVLKTIFQNFGYGYLVLVSQV